MQSVQPGMRTLWRGVVHPWLCDAMGHLTTRHYVAMFDDASWQLLAEATGWNPEAAGFRGRGWADVRQEIDYRAELRAGALVRIEGCITALGRTSLAALYEMRNAASGTLAATMRAKTVYFDLEKRRAIPLDDAMRARAAALPRVLRDAR